MSDQGRDDTKVIVGALKEGPRKRPDLQILVGTHHLQGGNLANIEPTTTPDEVKRVKDAAVPLLATSIGATRLLDTARRYGHGKPGFGTASISFSGLGLILSLLFTGAVFLFENHLPVHLKWAKKTICFIALLLAFAVIISLFA